MSSRKSSARSRSAAPDPALPPLVIDDAASERWDESAELLVVGFGGAGACAAIQARELGLDVLVIDRFHGGGATAISGGVFYSGGGTHIQREAGVDDSVDEMVKYLSMETQGVVSDELLREFCEGSADTLRWLERYGVPFEASLCPFKTSYPLDKYYLYYSGNEGLAPFKEKAKPAPRGHRAKGKGLPGASFYDPLRDSALRLGARTMTETRVTRLITDRDGAVVGVEAQRLEGTWARVHQELHKRGIQIVPYNPGLANKLREQCFEIEKTRSKTIRLRGTKGVVLAAGGFVYNRAMIDEHAPAYRKGMPLGTPADNGSGILLGQSVGGDIDRMGRVSAWRFINPPMAFAHGMIVNKQGERYINEMRYGAAIGEAMVDQNEGTALLIIDQHLKDLAREQSRPGEAQWFQRAPALLNLWFNSRRGETIEDLARLIKVPPDALRATLDAYNQVAESQQSDEFGKTPDTMRAMRRGPYYAIDCSIYSKRFPCPTLTLGGLVVDEQSGLVKREDGSTVKGLYAAGRTAVGICSRQYVSGLSIADCVFSGRRAARHAAG
ncbi:MAG: FAD-binding protein [Sandaracinaceae bacterium]|nr:FAD-binding protein [Sandaracinaceae bacterium]